MMETVSKYNPGDLLFWSPQYSPILIISIIPGLLAGPSPLYEVYNVGGQPPHIFVLSEKMIENNYTLVIEDGVKGL